MERRIDEAQKVDKPRVVSSSREMCCQGKGGIPLPLENRVPGARLVSVCEVTCCEFQGAVFPEGNLPIPLWAGLPCFA